MKKDKLLKHLAIAFGIALLGYIGVYSGIEHWRTRNGPWRVAFTNDVSGVPIVLINQPRLAITNVQIVFTNCTVPSAIAIHTVALDQPRPVPWEAPFGRCLFMDTTFLPGTVVFEMFGHEIQLLPRVLTIDKRERPWRSNQTIALSNAGSSLIGD